MRTINFPQTTVENTVANVTKVSPTFVTELKTAFRMFPPKTNMRFKQDFNGRLIIIVTVTYNNGRPKHLKASVMPTLFLPFKWQWVEILKDLSNI